MDRCCLDSKGASSGILIMWDRRVLERIEECAWEFTLAVLLEMSRINFLGLLRVFMALILIVIEGIIWTNWLVCFVGGICRGALENIPMSLDFLLRGPVKLAFV